jgi:hypothetical protein
MGFSMFRMHFVLLGAAHDLGMFESEHDFGVWLN